ncbi:hypothetical protein EMIT0P294_50315 [Pseudomonas sp. IT-P294]
MSRSAPNLRFDHQPTATRLPRQTASAQPIQSYLQPQVNPMTDHKLREPSDGWNMQALGIHFAEGTVSSALMSAFKIGIFFIFCYLIYRLLRLRWGVYQSLCATFLLLHILPIIILLIIKQTLHQ